MVEFVGSFWREKRAVKARFEWLESYEGEGKTIVMKIFDLWGNRLFETSKEFNLTEKLALIGTLYQIVGMRSNTLWSLKKFFIL